MHVELCDCVQLHVYIITEFMSAFFVNVGPPQVLSRPGLTVKQREYVAVLCMIGTGTFPQLRSHMRGALHCGATTDEVRASLWVGLQSGPRWFAAFFLLKRIALFDKK